ncbi:hypothetical protein F4818DRAFT_276276 [Hypoxylon cercidicola]|nr:hypothetical protein F4818DRAFT_276276 [Hypoxylon cercidicola]
MLPKSFKPSRSAVGAILLANTIASQETQSITDVWQLAPAPESLDGSIIEARITTISSVSRNVVTYEVDCPASLSPDNEGCRQLGIYPAYIYYTEGLFYGGMWSNRSSGLPTAWTCEMRDCTTCTASQAQTANCLLTIFYSESPSECSTTKIGSCELAQRSVPLGIIGGIQKLDPGRTHATYDIPQYISSRNEYLSDIGCEPKPTLEGTIYSAPYRVTSGGSSIYPTIALTTTPATGPVASQGQATATSQSTSSTSQSTSSTSQSASPTPSSGANGWTSGRFGYGHFVVCLALALSITQSIPGRNVM